MTILLPAKKLQPRDCILDDATHKYYWNPKGINEEMVISVTGVVNFFKTPYAGPPDAGWRGTHIHRWMYYKATDNFPPDLKAKGIDVLGTHSPEGIDCTDWIKVLTNLPFWDQVQILGSEYTMVCRRRSLGGQLDLLVQKEDGTKCLIDLKTKNDGWKGPTEKDKTSWMTQAGGYMNLLDTGDGAKGGCWVDKAVTLVVTPSEALWFPGNGESYDTYECAHLWSESWLTYLAWQHANPF